MRPGEVRRVTGERTRESCLEGGDLVVRLEGGDRELRRARAVDRRR